VPDKYKNEIKFAPTKAFLQPNEECKITATFTALKKKDYHIKVPIYAKNIYDHLKNSVGFYLPGSGMMQKNSSNTSRRSHPSHSKSTHLRSLAEEAMAQSSSSLKM